MFCLSIQRTGETSTVDEQTTMHTAKKELSLLLIVCYCSFRQVNKVIKSGGAYHHASSIRAHSNTILPGAHDRGGGRKREEEREAPTR